jgi:putative membrane protein insertion efficiency factor
MAKLIRVIIRLYQKIFSPDHGIFKRPYRGCRFYPSCSDYTLQAVEKFGAGKGVFLGVKRILKCHPWNEGGYDPI